MKFIRFKGIEHERTEDAPFVGALISAIDCHIGCKDCFNQHLKCRPTIYSTPQMIINEVKSNIFNEGMIFAGLEWSEQPTELISLVKECLNSDLKVMIYTGLSFKEFFKRVPGLMELEGKIYIKYGGYEKENEVYGYIDNHVTLASSNQHIKYVELKNIVA